MKVGQALCVAYVKVEVLNDGLITEQAEKTNLTSLSGHKMNLNAMLLPPSV